MSILALSQANESIYIGSTRNLQSCLSCNEDEYTIEISKYISEHELKIEFKLQKSNRLNTIILFLDKLIKLLI